MNENEYLVILYDYYNELLSDIQREYFEYYYFDNLSLSEISINTDKSRNAIHKCIKSVCNKLLFYEDKLKLYEKSNKIKNIISNIDDIDIKKQLEDLL